MKVGLDSNVLVASVKKVGEPFHDSVLELSKKMKDENVSGISSALALIELPGALASSSKMPIEKIYEVTASVQGQFNLKIMGFESYVDLAKDLMFEFRDLKSKWQIGSADFHHIATSIQESCDFFVTTDEKHLLRTVCREAFEKRIKIINPIQALGSFLKGHDLD
jgi:predicted nucleic acid-binding protein